MSGRAPLEERFSRFLASLPGAEAIDSLTLPEHPTKKRKADYLLENRQVILELKTLATDPAHKVEREMDNHRAREDFPVFYGERDLQKVLSRLPDGADINRRLFAVITRSINADVRSAEEQVSHTRHVLRLSHAAGLLVILNDSIDILSPEVASYRVASLMKRERTGNSEFEKLDFACLIFESHSLAMAPDLRVFPCMLIRGESAVKHSWFIAFFERFTAKWAAFNGTALLEGGSPRPDTLKFTATSELLAAEPTHLPRHEVWRRQYEANPHLRKLSDADVMKHGSRVMARLAPYFLKDGPALVPEAVVPLFQEFTCFLQEVNHRGLDMRDLPTPWPLRRADRHH